MIQTNKTDTTRHKHVHPNRKHTHTHTHTHSLSLSLSLFLSLFSRTHLLYEEIRHVFDIQLLGQTTDHIRGCRFCSNLQKIKRREPTRQQINIFNHAKHTTTQNIQQANNQQKPSTFKFAFSFQHTHTHTHTHTHKPRVSGRDLYDVSEPSSGPG